MRQIKEFTKNIAYSIISNAMNLIVTAATSLIIPLLLGANVKQYGYYQMYLFYTAYIGFFHFGLCDGVLLKEGGKKYSDLNKKEYSFQFLWLIGLEIVITCILLLTMFFIGAKEDYLFIAFAFGINLIIFLPRNLLAYILQATNRIKESSFITIIGRSIYLCGLLVLFLLKNSDYKYFVVADLIGKLIALIYVILRCKDIVFCKPICIKLGMHVVTENISIGIKLMLASISSMIISGIAQFAIQTKWSVETYGKISLTLSMTNLVLTFISAIAIVLYPTLRRVSNNTARELYGHIETILMILLMSSLVFCYPIQLVLNNLLPQYSDGIKYLPILFPVCIFSAKVALLVQTYMQVYRMEKKILQINLVGIGITLLYICISTLILKNLTMTVMAIPISHAIRCFYAEYILEKQIEIQKSAYSIFELIMIAIFIGFSYWSGMFLGMCIYAAIYVAYLALQKNNVKNAISCIKSF